jgi:hypothetical protein
MSPLKPTLCRRVPSGQRTSPLPSRERTAGRPEQPAQTTAARSGRSAVTLIGVTPTATSEISCVAGGDLSKACDCLFVPTHLAARGIASIASPRLTQSHAVAPRSVVAFPTNSDRCAQGPDRDDGDRAFERSVRGATRRTDAPVAPCSPEVSSGLLRAGSQRACVRLRPRSDLPLCRREIESPANGTHRSR